MTPAKALLLSGVLVGTGLLSFVVAEFLRRRSSRLGFTDHPNDRSLHVASTPPEAFRLERALEQRAVWVDDFGG